MANGFDVSMLQLEQRSRASQMRPHAHTPSQTMGEIYTDVMLNAAWTGLQASGKLYTRELAQRAEIEMAKAPSGEAFQAAFDEKIKPKSMLNMLLDPMGSASLISGASSQAQMRDIQDQKNLEKLNERLAIHNIGFMMTHLDNPADFNQKSEAIIAKVRAEQGLSPEFNAQISSLREQSDVYFAWKAQKQQGVVASVTSQYVRDTLNQASIGGGGYENLKGAIEDFKTNIMPEIPKNQQEQALRKVVSGIVGNVSDAKTAQKLIDENSAMFSPQERHQMIQKSLVNTAAAKNIRAADRSNMNILAQKSLEHGQVWDYPTIKIDPDLKAYSDYLVNAKSQMAEEGLGIGPMGYEAMASRTQDPNIKKQLLQTASVLSQEYSTDFFKMAKEEENIGEQTKALLDNAFFNLPVMNPETGELINGEPLTTSLANAANIFSDTKAAYFPNDNSIQNAIPEKARNEYAKVYKSLDDQNKWDFLKAAHDGLTVPKANLDGMWPHRQLSKIAGDKTVATFSVMASDFDQSTVREAWDIYLDVKSRKGTEAKDRNHALEKIRTKMDRVLTENYQISALETQELGYILGIKSTGRFRAVIDSPSDSYLYIHPGGFFNNKLKGVILPGDASGINNASEKLLKQLESFKIPGTNLMAGSVLNSTIKLGDKNYKIYLENIPGTYKSFALKMIDENGFKRQIKGGQFNLK